VKPVAVILPVIVAVVYVRNVGNVVYLNPWIVNMCIPVVRTEMLLWNKCPPEMRGDPVEIDAHMHVWSHGSPGPVIIVRAPGNPCRSPFIARDPHPSEVIVEIPSSVMECSPAPAIIGNPGPSKVGVNPVSACGIGPESIRIIEVRPPDITIFRGVYPIAKRLEFIIKCLD
jgi:hypothetical protein